MSEKKPRKKKVVGVGKLKKATVEKTKVAHPHKVRFGTRNEFSEVRTFKTAPQAKQAIVKELKSWQPWCTRYNHDGLVAIDDALQETDNLIFHEARARIDCCFDHHTDMWLCAEYWIEP